MNIKLDFYIQNNVKKRNVYKTVFGINFKNLMVMFYLYGYCQDYSYIDVQYKLLKTVL